MNIQWYPGHMTKTKRMMAENIALVDVVVEMLDARIPYSSKNPDLDSLSKNKKRIIVLNKADLADEGITEKWKAYFENKGFAVILSNSVTGAGLDKIVKTARELMKEKIERQMQRGRLYVPIRAMIAGIPNVGKSTLINYYAGLSVAKTGDKPGVTRGKQWVRLKKDFELLDTPGILWPKFEDEAVGIRLAITGAINDKVFDSFEISLKLIEILAQMAPAAIENRYKLLPGFTDGKKPQEILEKIAEARSFIKKGGELDLERCSIILLDEYRGGKLGRISLEAPNQL